MNKRIQRKRTSIICPKCKEKFIIEISISSNINPFKIPSKSNYRIDEYISNGNITKENKNKGVIKWK